MHGADETRGAIAKLPRLAEVAPDDKGLEAATMNELQQDRHNQYAGLDNSGSWMVLNEEKHEDAINIRSDLGDDDTGGYHSWGPYFQGVLLFGGSNIGVPKPKTLKPKPLNP